MNKIPEPSVNVVDASNRQSPRTSVVCSLSGGGTRAALFAAGALLAIVTNPALRLKKIVGVSGSALLCLEVVVDQSATDREAIQNAITRIMKYGYWPRKWALWSMFAAVIAFFYLVNFRSVTGWHVLWAAATSLAIGAVATILLLRGFGIRFSGSSKFLQTEQEDWRRIYTATGDEVRTATSTLPERQVILDNVLFGITNLSKPAVQSTAGDSLTEQSPYEIAAASAAFPLAFTPRQVGLDLVSDGGITDNLGIDTAMPLTLPGEHLVIVDASQDPDELKNNKHPYAKPTGKRRAKYFLINIMAAVFLAYLFSHIPGSEIFPGNQLHRFIGFAVLDTILIILLCQLDIYPVNVLVGIRRDVNLLRKMWPLTLNANARNSQQRIPSTTRHTIVSLREQVSEPERVRDAPRAPTTLFKLDPGTARDIVEIGYTRTNRQLGASDQQSLLDWIRGLSN